jgi:DNA-binding GntR family transcriptional regulator
MSRNKAAVSAKGSADTQQPVTDSAVLADGPIPRTKLSDEVAHRIREAILTGRLKAGMRVVQEDWAQRLGVSRMPVRDAVSRLEAEGLVTVSASSGTTTVAEVSESDIEDAYEITAVAAGVAARRAAHRLTTEELAGLRRLHDRLITAVVDQDDAAAQECNFEFHRRINRGSGSARLLSLIRMVSAGVPHFSIREMAELAETTVTDHAEILDALEQRDSDRAMHAIQHHLLSTRHTVVDNLRRHGFFG